MDENLLAEAGLTKKNIDDLLESVDSTPEASFDYISLNDEVEASKCLNGDTPIPAGATAVLKDIFSSYPKSELK